MIARGWHGTCLPRVEVPVQDATLKELAPWGAGSCERDDGGNSTLHAFIAFHSCLRGHRLGTRLPVWFLSTDGSSVDNSARVGLCVGGGDLG